MGVISLHRPVKLIASMIYKEEGDLAKAEERLIAAYGETEPALFRVLPFDYTDYYADEFGAPLFRKLLCFRRLKEVEEMPGIKVETNAMEESLMRHGKRTVNIDPGYVSEAKLILLTTKDYVHRIYIGERIFAESTLYFKGGSFNAWPWTYPDYASDEMIGYFNAVRENYMKDTRDGR